MFFIAFTLYLFHPPLSKLIEGGYANIILFISLIQDSPIINHHLCMMIIVMLLNNICFICEPVWIKMVLFVQRGIRNASDDAMISVAWGLQRRRIFIVIL